MERGGSYGVVYPGYGDAGMGYGMVPPPVAGALGVPPIFAAALGAVPGSPEWIREQYRRSRLRNQLLQARYRRQGRREQRRDTIRDALWRMRVRRQVAAQTQPPPYRPAIKPQFALPPKRVVGYGPPQPQQMRMSQQQAPASEDAAMAEAAAAEDAAMMVEEDSGGVPGWAWAAGAAAIGFALWQFSKKKGKQKSAGSSSAERG